MAAKMTPEEEGSDVREMVREMSRMTNKILIFGIILILAILAVLMYCGILTFPSGIRIQAAQLLGDRGGPYSCSASPFIRQISEWMPACISIVMLSRMVLI